MKNTSDKGIFKTNQQRQSPVPPPPIGKSLVQYHDPEQLESYTSMLLNQSNLEKAILLKQAIGAEATDVAQNAATQSQRSRLPQPGKHVDIEVERYTKADQKKKQNTQVLDFASSW